MLQTPNKEVIYINRFRFFTSLIICWLFAIICIFTVFIPGLIFFGLCAVLMTYRLFEPKKKIILNGAKGYKGQIKKDFEARLIDQGIFTYTDNGFEVIIEGQNQTIAWTDIQALFGYKVDLYTLDEIRMDVFCDDDISFTISEETPGWYVFLEKIEEQFPAIKQNWNLEIAFPAFAENLTLLYEKHSKTQEVAIDLYYEKD